MITILYTANCRTCNPHNTADPVTYDDREKRDHEAQQHSDRTGHTVDIGITA